ncbi:hypothetical protein AYO49_00030 [Verrucomicrobiaceae bacterium SCGC AG-212-N21]|nr:hypothetical protein AYO49_00030 [Verrucomicrobiaceae bacterium SCGC AG-212-N21]
MSASAASFLLPDAELSWKLWKSLAVGKAETVDTPADCRQGSRPMVIGLPATACRTIGLMLPTTEKSVIPAMVEAQLEKRGIHHQAAPAPNFVWHLLSQSGGQSFVSVDVLSHPFPADLVVNHAVTYTPALRLVSLPPNELTLIEEQGLLVLAANQAGKLWHSHVVGFVEMAVADLAREIELAKLSLEAQEGFGVVRGVSLVGERLGLLKAEIRKHVAVQIETPATIPANRGLNLSTLPKLLPTQVFDAQRARELRRRIASILVLTGILYSILFVMGWWYLRELEQQARTLENRVALTRGPATEVKTTAQRWRALEPAFDSQRYPMIQLDHLTRIMPPSGLVVKEFEAKPTSIDLRCEARDLQTAEQFLEDLKKHPKLSRFDWKMPTPDIRNKVATFKVQGTLLGGKP